MTRPRLNMHKREITTKQNKKWQDKGTCHSSCPQQSKRRQQLDSFLSLSVNAVLVESSSLRSLRSPESTQSRTQTRPRPWQNGLETKNNQEYSETRDRKRQEGRPWNSAERSQCNESQNGRSVGRSPVWKGPCAAPTGHACGKADPVRAPSGAREERVWRSRIKRRSARGWQRTLVCCECLAIRILSCNIDFSFFSLNTDSARTSYYEKRSGVVYDISPSFMKLHEM